MAAFSGPLMQNKNLSNGIFQDRAALVKNFFPVRPFAGLIFCHPLCFL